MPWDIWVIFFVLGVIVPWRGRVRLRHLLSKPTVESAERLSLYASTILFQWFAVAIAGWRAWAHGFSAEQLGLVLSDGVRLSVIAVLGAAFLAALQWLNLRRVGRMHTESRGQIQALAERILPRTLRETILFLALAVTAGVCEEFLYRGFAIGVFTRVGLPAWATVVVSSGLFGLAHLYQGRGGLVSSMILGVLFGAVRLSYGSLLPVMSWHTAVDVVAGFAGPRYLIPRSTAARGANV